MRLSHAQRPSAILLLAALLLWNWTWIPLHIAGNDHWTSAAAGHVHSSPIVNPGSVDGVDFAAVFGGHRHDGPEGENRSDGHKTHAESDHFLGLHSLDVPAFALLSNPLLSQESVLPAQAQLPVACLDRNSARAPPRSTHS